MDLLPDTLINIENMKIRVLSKHYLTFINNKRILVLI